MYKRDFRGGLSVPCLNKYISIHMNIDTNLKHKLKSCINLQYERGPSSDLKIMGETIEVYCIISYDSH
jgi:hypothetical protein